MRGCHSPFIFRVKVVLGLCCKVYWACFMNFSYFRAREPKFDRLARFLRTEQLTEIFGFGYFGFVSGSRLFLRRLT